MGVPGDRIFALGVGAQKAGTTWLHHYLSGHPQIYMSPIKEMHFFDELYLPDFVGELPKRYYLGWLKSAAAAYADSGGTNAQALARTCDLIERAGMAGDMARYLDFFAARMGRATVFGEVTPSYSMLSGSQFCAIAAAHPDVRPIFIMRDPVDRYWSAMRMSEREGNTADAARIAVDNLRNPHDVLRGRYDRTLAALREGFGAGGFLALFYEELFTEDAIRRICDFLSVAPHPAAFGTRHNASPSERRIGADVERAIFEVFADVYAGVEHELGHLPPRWRARIDAYATPARPYVFAEGSAAL